MLGDRWSIKVNAQRSSDTWVSVSGSFSDPREKKLRSLKRLGTAKTFPRFKFAAYLPQEVPITAGIDVAGVLCSGQC